MNWYFYKVFIPLNLAFIIGLLLLFFGFISVHPGLIFFSWVLIGPIGIGVGYHRLFSHRQFETNQIFEALLAVLGTLAAYAPVLYWSANHRYHHKHSDTELDPSSPEKYGFWESFLWYRLRQSALNKIDINNYCVKKIIKNPVLRIINKNFLVINVFVSLLLLLISPTAFFSAYIFPVFIEHLRINLVSSLSHLPLPLNYRNFSTKDNSYNNIILGYLTFGFAWHNNHHHNERQVNLSYNWWEVDLEGAFAQLISKKQKLHGKVPQNSAT